MKTTAKESVSALQESLQKQGNRLRILDAELIRKDGTKGFNEISVSLIRDSEGKPVGFRGISRDVTERKQMERGTAPE